MGWGKPSAFCELDDWSGKLQPFRYFQFFNFCNFRGLFAMRTLRHFCDSLGFAKG